MERVGKSLVYNPDGKILALFRSETHPHLAHYVDFPGGIIEQDESPEVAMAREIEEETGHTIEASQLEIAESGVSKNTDGSETQYYLGKIALSNAPDITISWEHEGYEWLTSDELLARMAEQTEQTDTFWDYVKKHLADTQA